VTIAIKVFIAGIIADWVAGCEVSDGSVVVSVADLVEVAFCVEEVATVERPICSRCGRVGPVVIINDGL